MVNEETRNHLAQVLQDLGEQLRRWGGQENYTRAEQCYKHAQRLFEIVFGPQSEAMAAVLSDLGELYQTQDAFAEAKHTYQQAQVIRQRP